MRTRLSFISGSWLAPGVVAACLALSTSCSDATAFAVRDGLDAGPSGSGGTGGTAGAGGTAGSSGTGGDAGSAGSDGRDGGSCASNWRITEIDVGGDVNANENEAALMPIVLSPRPAGGSRLAWMDNVSRVHVIELDANDRDVGSAALTLPAHDLADLYADDRGGALLVARDARGGGNLNCGTLSNLCGSSLPSTASCYDMYLVRFDGSTEAWAAKLTDSTAALPPYSTGPTGPSVIFIWSPYAHHGRIAFDGSRYAAYFGVASSSSGDCNNGGGANGRGINVYQGDRMKVVASDGALQSGGFDFGCSTSGYERVIWDPGARKFVAVCKTGNRIAIAPPGSGTSMTVYPLDPYYGNLGNLAVSPAGGYWLTTSDRQTGQPASANGLADVHLLHFSTGMADRDLLLASDVTLNERAPHLAPFGATRLLASWETSTTAGDLSPSDRNRRFFVQAVNATTGTAEGSPFYVPDIVGNRYHDLRGYPDGSVAYAAPGSAPSRIKVVRVLPCPP